MMIKEKLEQLHNEVSLHAEAFNREKREPIRENIISFMETCGGEFTSKFVSKELFSHVTGIQNPSPYFSLAFFSRLKFVAVALIVMLTVGVSVSYAAQDSLPGDSLYGVKTNINEEVRSLLTFSSSNQAKLHVEFAEERIKEMEKLLARGTVKPEIAGQLEENFKKQANVVGNKIHELASLQKHQEALEVSSKFESSLKAHESVLNDLNEKEASSTESLLGSVEDQIDSAKETRIDAETKIKVDKAIEKETAQAKMQFAKTTIGEVSVLIDRLEEDILIEENSFNEGKMTLERSSRNFKSARAKYLKGDYSDSYILFEKATQQAEEARTYLTIALNLEIFTKKFPKRFPLLQLKSNLISKR